MLSNLDIFFCYYVFVKLLLFQLEYCTDACTCDYVEIHDGPDEGSPVLARVCGHDLPTPARYDGQKTEFPKLFPPKKVKKIFEQPYL